MQINLTKDEQHFLLDILGTASQFDIVEKMSDDWQDEDEDFRDFDSDPNTIFESLNNNPQSCPSLDEMKIRIFDLRELWIRVINDCRYEFKSSSSNDS